MWNWDPGRLDYVQFGNVVQIARLVTNYDIRSIDKETAQRETGLPFKSPDTHSLWRNYSRILKTSLLVYEENGIACPTEFAKILAKTGEVTCDEYMHFIVRTYTDPPFVLSSRGAQEIRYPLLFSLKYLLTKAIRGEDEGTDLYEIIGAYEKTGFTGKEEDNKFIKIVNASTNYKSLITDREASRQARESLIAMSQISYLHFQKRNNNHRMFISLSKKDAEQIFESLEGLYIEEEDREKRIQKTANLFSSLSTAEELNYNNSIMTESLESGFAFTEGRKIKKAHITIERNSKLRHEFFSKRPAVLCDLCILDTHETYPWTERVLELHHIMPLSSGTRVMLDGTILDDLVPLCPNCHRAVHRYYDNWLRKEKRQDFSGIDESKQAYEKIKTEFRGAVYGG